MHWPAVRPPPFEPLPADPVALRLRAVRDGLIISGWLVTGFALVVVTSVIHSVGYDAFAYWSIDLHNPWALSLGNNFTLGGFRYAPPIALLFAPLGLLPWWLFLLLWGALLLATLFWLGGRWALVLLALPPIALELYHGNIHLLIAAAVVLGMRYPAAWSFVLLTKVTPGIGVLWFAVRREWRSLAIALGATAAFALISTIVAPQFWGQWLDSLFSNLDQPQYYSIPPPAPIRLPIAAVIVIWGARTNRPWTVAVAATLGLPIIWPHGLAVLAAAVPLLRRGDRAAREPGWQSFVSLRSYLAWIGVFLGGALALAAVFADPLRRLLDDASSNLAPYLRRS
jgi:Glycosyltransferase family 87